MPTSENICYQLIEKNEKNEILDMQKILRVRHDSFGSEGSIDNFFPLIINNDTSGISIKKLLIILEYYGLTKFTKINSKVLKKHELLEMLIIFETDPSNFEIVKKRKQLWNYIELLKSDKIMKRFVIW